MMDITKAAFFNSESVNTIHRENMGAPPIHHASAYKNLSPLESVNSAMRNGKITEDDPVGERDHNLVTSKTYNRNISQMIDPTQHTMLPNGKQRTSSHPWLRISPETPG